MEKEYKFNPFDIEQILDDKWKKDYYYKQMQVFTIMKEQADMMNRIRQKKGLHENDFEYRDIIFSNTLKEEERFPNYFYWAQQHLSESKGIDGYSKYSEIVKKCQRRKMEFWKKYSNVPPTTEEKSQTKKIISKVKQYQITPLSTIKFYQFLLNSTKIKWEHKGPSVATFFVLSLASMLLLKIAKGSNQSKAILFCLGTFSGNVYADFRSKHQQFVQTNNILFVQNTFILIRKYMFFLFIDSENIFNNIPQLPDQEIEFEREKIINYCFPVDVQLMSKAFLD